MDDKRFIDIPIFFESYEDIDNLVDKVINLIPYLEKKNIYLNLDMDIPPNIQKDILERINSNRVNVVFNIGLMFYLGYSHKEFIDTLFDKIRSIVIYNSGTSGAERTYKSYEDRFEYIFDELKKRNYKYNIRIQSSLFTKEDTDVYIGIIKDIL